MRDLGLGPASVDNELRHLRITVQALSVAARPRAWATQEAPMVDARDTADTLAEMKERGARRIALLIAALAALLAIVQTIGDNAAKDAVKYNIDASNLWSFYQAKTIRQTSVRTAAELL